MDSIKYSDEKFQKLTKLINENEGLIGYKHLKDKNDVTVRSKNFKVRKTKLYNKFSLLFSHILNFRIDPLIFTSVKSQKVVTSPRKSSWFRLCKQKKTALTRRARLRVDVS